MCLWALEEGIHIANRFWVGGAGAWADDDNHWATSSGGSPGNGNLPTTTDDVIIDNSSGFGGGGTITIAGLDVVCHDFTVTTTHTFTIHDGGLGCYGSVTLRSNLTFGQEATPLALELLSVDAGESIDTSGCTIVGEVRVYSTGGWSLLSDLELTSVLRVHKGTFDANDFNITCSETEIYPESNLTLNMGSGTWEVTGLTWAVEYNEPFTVTVNAETSLIKFTGTGPDMLLLDEVQFTSRDNVTYYDLWFNGNFASPHYIQFTGTNVSFHEIKVDPPTTVKFTGNTTTVVESFDVSGTSGNTIALNSNDGSTQFTLSKSSGTVACDYLNISNSNATGGAAWYAGANSADTANNDGWIFSAAPTQIGSSRSNIILQ